MNPAATSRRLHRWSRAEYDHMVAAGVFHPEARLELVDGEIIEMSPQGSLHATTIQLLAGLAGRLFGEGYHLRIQMPLALDDASEPEPDIAVVRGHFLDYREAHPATAELVIEVADASVRYDRQTEAALYARCGIPDYWLVNIAQQRLEVFQQPENGRYRSYRRLKRGEVFTPAGRPDQVVEVAAVLL